MTAHPTPGPAGPGSFTVEAQAVVHASADTVLSFVLDLDRYRMADRKIWRVRHVTTEGDDVVAGLWARFGGMPVAVTQRMHRTGSERIDVRNEPSWQDRFTTFHGEFACRPASGGTEVTHRYTFGFSGPARLMAPLLRRWLARDIRREVDRLQAILDPAPAPFPQA